MDGRRGVCVCCGPADGARSCQRGVWVARRTGREVRGPAVLVEIRDEAMREKEACVGCGAREVSGDLRQYSPGRHDTAVVYERVLLVREESGVDGGGPPVLSRDGRSSRSESATGHSMAPSSNSQAFMFTNMNCLLRPKQVPVAPSLKLKFQLRLTLAKVTGTLGLNSVRRTAFVPAAVGRACIRHAAAQRRTPHHDDGVFAGLMPHDPVRNNVGTSPCSGAKP
ncbi:hypothetical protein HPB47_002310 [Ixodes persulcatus]|uniref:Uncharacterized protein n=1 Tax=Ixodes persulcatus TaxID=34615 RepID=A0AC60PMH6_IXOPE|nr:hypothetical protein HPB47_002310 [Ixodes persulcatus]